MKIYRYLAILCCLFVLPVLLTELPRESHIVRSHDTSIGLESGQEFRRFLARNDDSIRLPLLQQPR
jgi:hypothetical protein